jgi:hypothetical protein
MEVTVFLGGSNRKSRLNTHVVAQLVGVDFARQYLLKSFVEFSARLELRHILFTSVVCPTRLGVMVNPGLILERKFTLLLNHGLNIDAFALI